MAHITIKSATQSLGKTSAREDMPKYEPQLGAQPFNRDDITAAFIFDTKLAAAKKWHRQLINSEISPFVHAASVASDAGQANGQILAGTGALVFEGELLEAVPELPRG